MTIRDHQEAMITEFRGLFRNGPLEHTPVGYQSECLNTQFVKNGIGTRNGSSLFWNLGFNVQRLQVYKREGEVQRLLVLDGLGRIWDTVTLTEILFIPAMTDFSMVTIFNRAYITPHNGKVGLPGEKVYVYEGTGVARLAGGFGPAEFTPMVASDSANTGKCEVGLHILAVGYQTVSGFETVFGGYTQFTFTGELKLDVASIPIGPAGTIARYLVCTKVIDAEEFNGDHKSQTYYKISGGVIADNVTTTITDLDFYDADLIDDVSYLAEQLDEIPAGVGIGLYRARMIVWGENLNSSIIRASKAGEPESFNAVEGYATVNPGDSGGGVKNCFEYRNQLIVCKSQRTYSTLDNNNEAAFWEVGLLDGSIGTECHGVSRTLDYGTNTEERVFIADRSGLRMFVGAYSDETIVTFNIDEEWGAINQPDFHKIEVVLDPKNYRIYVTLPMGTSGTMNLLYGDYMEGLDSIKWCYWKFPNSITSIAVDTVNSVPVFKYSSSDGTIMQIDPTSYTDGNTSIHTIIKFAPLPTGSSEHTVNHYTGMRLRANGVGVLDSFLYGMDELVRIQPISIILTPPPGIGSPLFRGFNFTNETCGVKLEVASPGGYINLTKFTLYIAPLWQERPVVS